MSKIIFTKIFCPPVRMLHRLGSPSQPVLSHHPSQEEGRTGGSQSSPGPGHQALPWVQRWAKPGTRAQAVWEHLPMSPKECTISPFGLPCLWASPEQAARPPRGGCSQSPHSLITRQVMIAGNVFLLLKGEERKALLMPYHLVATFPLYVIFAPVIHSISKEEWEDWRVVIKKAENMEENERLINCQNCSAMSLRTISALQLPMELTPLPQYLLLLSKRWWSGVTDICVSFFYLRKRNWVVPQIIPNLLRARWIQGVDLAQGNTKDVHLACGRVTFPSAHPLHRFGTLMQQPHGFHSGGSNSVPSAFPIQHIARHSQDYFSRHRSD